MRASRLLASCLFAACLLPACGPALHPEMVRVEAGSFMHGGIYADEKPVHLDTLSAFFLGRTEVTVAQFRAFIAATGYRTTAETLGDARGIVGGKDGSFAGLSWKAPGYALLEDYPVCCVSWYDAAAYCNWLSGERGLTPVYSSRGTADFMGWTLRADDASKDSFAIDWSSKGYRLPTETEWEYAARGGAKPAGYAYSGGDDLSEVSWNYKNAPDGPRRVGTRKANEVGLYDMNGNVWEWCQDWWSYYSEEPGFDPRGSEGGSYRVMRGGGWYGVALYSYNPYYRGSCDPADRSIAVGFRVARYE